MNDRVETYITDVWCPTCKALRGVPCSTIDDVRKVSPGHESRVELSDRRRANELANAKELEHPCLRCGIEDSKTIYGCDLCLTCGRAAASVTTALDPHHALVVELTQEELEVLGRSLKYAEAWLIVHAENSPELPRIEGVRQVLFSAWEASRKVETT